MPSTSVALSPFRVRAHASDGDVEKQKQNKNARLRPTSCFHVFESVLRRTFGLEGGREWIGSRKARFFVKLYAYEGLPCRVYRYYKGSPDSHAMIAYV